MSKMTPAMPADAEKLDGPALIALAQKLARDAERHALLSESLASQADRLMHAGLARLQAGARPASEKSC